MNIMGKERNEIILELAEEKNGITLNRDAIAITAIKNSPAGTTDYDASVDIISIDPAVYYNQQTLIYDKVDVNTELSALNPTLDMKEYTTTTELFPQVAEKYGLVFTVDDILLDDVDHSVSPWEVYFKAKDTSPIYKTEGKGVKFIAPETKIDLSSLLTVLNLTGLRMPSDDLDRIQGPLLTYPTYSDDEAMMASYVVGYRIATPSDNDWLVAELLSESTGEYWTFDSQGYTLSSAVVAYNGDTKTASELGYHVNTAKSNVLIFTCSELGLVGGYIVVHY